jgi:hypothetical protein
MEELGKVELVRVTRSSMRLLLCVSKVQKENALWLNKMLT